MIKKIGITLAAIVASVGAGTFVASSPAMASQSQCSPDGVRVCVWTGAGYSGTFGQWNASYIIGLGPVNGSGGCLTLASPYNNSISGFYNDNPNQAIFYDSNNCTGLKYYIADPYFVWSNLAGSNYNDTFGSIWVHNG